MQSGASREVAEEVVRRLIDEDFINTGRYVKAFVHDKFRLTRWGKVKIAAALRQKHIPAALINTHLNEIDDKEYRQVLRDILNAKARTLTDPRRMTQKLVAYATSRGYEVSISLTIVNELVNEMENDVTD